MARRSFFFITFTICNILVRGNISPTSDSTLPPIPVLPECQTLLDSLSPSTQNLPLAVGESIWFVGRIYAMSGSTSSGTSPTTTPQTTNPPTTNPPTTNPPTTNPPTTNPPTTNPPTTNPPTTNPPTTNPPTTTPTTGTPSVCPKDNQCSIFSFTDDCDSIKVLVSMSEDRSICLKQASFNKKTNSVALFKSVLLPCQSSPFVVQSSFGFFGVVSQDGKMIISQQTSVEIKNTQKTQVILVAAAEGGEWLLYTNCDKSVVFVLYSEQVVKDCQVENFNEAINAKLTSLQITPEQLKSIRTEISIDINVFIQPLPPPPPPSASGTTGGVSVKVEAEGEIKTTEPEEEPVN